MAAQVTPPMMEKELIAMIVDTLPVSRYEKMIGYMPSRFADLVVTGERIEVGALLRTLMGTPGGLPFKSSRSGMIHVIVHGRCEVGG